MRKILLLICILSITICAKAQIFGKHYDEGSYYDLDGVKHTGLISWAAPEKSLFSGDGDKIYYKPEKKADNSKIKSTELRSFIVGTDSFVVSQNKIFSWKPFLHVLVNTNDTLKLYCSMEKRPAAGFGMGVGSIGAVALSVGASFSYNKKSYYYGTTPDNVVKLDKKHFIEVMSAMMADKPETVERIKSKKLRLGDMDDLLYFYKYGIMPPAQAPDQFSGSN